MESRGFVLWFFCIEHGNFALYYNNLLIVLDHDGFLSNDELFIALGEKRG